jgi:hypothetical protein
MRRLISLAGIVALIAVLSPTSALAKGPTSATIEGPGITGTIDVSGEPGSGEPGSSATLGQLAEHAGLFAVGFGAGTGQVSTRRPEGELGAELTLVFTVPTSATASDTVVQRLYPYADGGAVTYTDARQTVMGMQTAGGWYTGGEPLSAALTEVGVPAQPPSQGPPLTSIVAGTIVACALGLLAIVARRTARHRRETIDALAHP